MALVTVSRATDDVAVVRMDDPGRYNALSSAMVAELRRALAELGGDGSVRAVVLTGEGRGFCSGANMAGDEALPEEAAARGPVGRIHVLQENLAAMILAVHELPQPVIAAVHGAAIGGGLALALACDLRVAARDAFFASHFIRVGLSSCDVGTSYFLPRLVPPAVALELMLTGRRVEAEEARALGLVNRIVPPEDVVDTAVTLAGEICANSEYGVLMTKAGFWANLEAGSLRQAIQLENRTQVLGTFTGNMSEAGAAFREGRPPVWMPM